MALGSAYAQQTMWVHQGQVHYAYTTSQLDTMPVVDATSLTVLGKTFELAQVDSINVTSEEVADNAIGVSYAGDKAQVVVSGNIATHIEATVKGAHVAVLQDGDVATEYTYTLSGTSANGSFYQDGSYKITLRLNGLTLTNPDSAAINIRDGKRIAIELVEGTTTTLVDGANGPQKAAFMVNGHSEFKSGGALIISGNTKHGFWGDEYVELKKTVGSITVNKAVKDGMSINQYLEMKGGTITISGVGDDGIQVDLTDDETDELNGQVIISGGTINVAVTAAAAKGINAEGEITISGGSITATTSGGGTWDSDESKTKACAGIKGDKTIDISGGTLNLTSTGAGGKGISLDGVLTVSGGDITIKTSGNRYTYGGGNSSDYRSSPKGIKCDADININGGNIKVTTTGNYGEGIESKAILTINDGTVEVNSYDDGINSKSDLNINGGFVFVNASNNDGIDSNHDLNIGGGVVVTYGASQPECGLDAADDDRSNPGYVHITGGTLVAVGGGTSYPHAFTDHTLQPVFIYSGSVSQNTSLALNDASGNNVWAFTQLRSYTSGGGWAPGGPGGGGPGGGSQTIVISSPKITSGSTYTLYTGATIKSGATAFHGLYYQGDAVQSNGTSVGSKAATTPYTTISSSGGGWNW